MTEKLENIEFADDLYSRVRFNIVNEEKGTTSFAELAVPENFEKGKNPYWDKIIDTVSIDDLKQQREIKKSQREEQDRIQEEKRQSDIESRELRELFNRKANYLKMPFVETDEQKMNIRKSPNQICLDYYVFKLMNLYQEKNNLGYDEFFDLIDDALFDDDE